MKKRRDRDLPISPRREAGAGRDIGRYESDSVELSRRFAKEVAGGIEQILAFPDAWQIVELGLRRYRLHSFPYGLVYRVRDAEVLVVAVMHHRREPGYWKDRT